VPLLLPRLVLRERAGVRAVFGVRAPCDGVSVRTRGRVDSSAVCSADRLLNCITTVMPIRDERICRSLSTSMPKRRRALTRPSPGVPGEGGLREPSCLERVEPRRPSRIGAAHLSPSPGTPGEGLGEGHSSADFAATSVIDGRLRTKIREAGNERCAAVRQQVSQNPPSSRAD
jgi:hypothetical protein